MKVIKNKWKDFSDKSWNKYFDRLSNRRFRYRITKTPIRLLIDIDYYKDYNGIQKGCTDYYT